MHVEIAAKLASVDTDGLPEEDLELVIHGEICETFGEETELAHLFWELTELHWPCDLYPGGHSECRQI